MSSSLSLSLSRRAFTMIELVFIIVILGILGAIAVPKMAASREDATVVAYMQDIQTAMQAIPAYYIAQGKVEKYSDAFSFDASRWVVKENKKIFSRLKPDGKIGTEEPEGHLTCIAIETEPFNDPTSKKLRIRAFKNGTSGACLRIANELIKMGAKDQGEPDIIIDYASVSVQF